MNALIALGLGIVIFALVVGVGVVVIQNFGDSVAECAEDYTYNATQQKCVNSTNEDPTDPTNTAWTTNQTLIGYLSSNLITWVPAVIALGVGLLFIGSLMKSKGGNY